MAGEWIKVTLELPDKPEVHYIANALNLDPDAVVGKLIRVWSWFDKNTRDGNAFGVTFALLDRITSVTGFGEAMSLAGWMEQRDKTLVMPNFERHNAESSKKRALTAKRVEKFRNAQSVTSALPEKRREEKNIKATTGAVAPDPVKEEIWKTGKALLMQSGFDVKSAGSFLGKLCKEYGQILVLESVRDCVSTTPAEPHTWLMARCQERRKGNGKFNPVQHNARQLAQSLARSVVPEVFDDLHGEVHALLPRSGNDG